MSDKPEPKVVEIGIASESSDVPSAPEPKKQAAPADDPRPWWEREGQPRPVQKDR